MKAKPFIKIALLSDLHVHDEGENGPGYLGVHSESSSNKDPFLGLNQLIASDKLDVDLVFCAGDICDKANQNALRYAWEKLHTLKDKLKADKLIATAGNHDMDSRHLNNEFDAKGALQQLTPFFPVDDEELYDRYWSRNFVITSHKGIRILILNSAAYHGYAEEYKHGRVSQYTLDKIAEELGSTNDPYSLNIFLCHHHPHKHGDISQKDYSNMMLGEKLIDLLGSGSFGNWLIIHGHTHHPRVCYGAYSGDNPPIVFSAGSFAARLSGDLQSNARNQFYILELYDVKDFDSYDLFMPGTFTAWDWIQNIGWQKAGSDSGLPKFGGFGSSASINSIVEKIFENLSIESTDFLSYEEILEFAPDIAFLLPKQHNLLIDRLSAKNLACKFDENGQLRQVGLRNET